MKKIFCGILFAILYFTAQAQNPTFTSPIGTGNTTFPFRSNVSNKAQWIYHPTDFTPAIMSGFINKLYIRVHATLGANGTASFTNFTIKMGHTNLNNTVNGPWMTGIAGLNTVFQAANYTIAVNKGTWIVVELQTPFFYNGTDKLILEASHTNQNGGFYIVQNVPQGNRRQYGSVANANSNTATTGLMYIGLDILGENDLGVLGIENPVNLNDLCAGDTKFSIKVKNFGANDISTGNISYSVDGSYQGTASISGVINPFDTQLVELPGYIRTQYNVPVELKVWSHDPNNLQDPLAVNDTYKVIITPNKLGVEMNEMPDTSFCKGTSIILDAGVQPNTFYTWSNGTQMSTNTIVSTGRHWVWAYNTNGCEATDTFDVHYAPMPEAAQNIAIIDLNNGMLLFNIGNVHNVNNYVWDFGDGSALAYGPGPLSHRYVQAGNYTVVLKLMNDCDTIERSHTLFWQGSTGIAKLHTDENFTIFPNPANDILHLNYQDKKVDIEQYVIVNLLGQAVLSGKGTNLQKIEIGQLPLGTYILQIHTAVGIVNKTFVKH